MVIQQTEHETAHSLQCMEIWGGMGAEDTGVSAPGVDVWVYSRPHEGATDGGDVHYLSACGGGNIVRTALADVSGHGADVAELAGILRRLMRKHINTPDQSRFARALNAEFSARAETGKFATALLATYFVPDSSLIVVNAGHPKPLLRRAGSNEWLEMTARMDEAKDRVKRMGIANLPLGVIDDTEYEQFAVGLSPGDRVVLYTDALVEARAPGGSMLGEAGLREMLASADVDSARDTIDGVLERVAAYTERPLEELGDDMTMVLLDHTGAPLPPQSAGDRLRTIGRLLGILDV